VTSGPFTLLAVHAHPDDESSGTGGLLRLAANHGHTTVLITCTNGELGDVKGPAWRLTPRTSPADRQHLANIRRQELARASTILGVSHLYMLGYHDSGMQGWETNEAPQAFTQVDGEAATARVVEILRRHRPHVVITYDANGGYGHPDHIMAHRITVAAVEAAADTQRFPQLGAAWHVPKFYHTAWARSELLRVFKVLHCLGRHTPLRDAKFDPNDWGCPDALITTRIDVRPVMRDKWQALFTHRSQMGRGDFFWWFLRLTGRWLYPYESFRCVYSNRPITPPETDIFADL
jgi:LmbE family N-acetylglucosaminyl deacetylase